MLEQSLILIKPHAFQKKKMGTIISMLERAEFKIVGLKSVKLTSELVRRFYFVHKGKPFFDSLTDYMSSDTIAAICVEKDDCVEELRKLVGNTNPSKAEEGTIRNSVGEDIQANGVHASDCVENAQKEIRFFFSDIELYSYTYLQY